MTAASSSRILLSVIIVSKSLRLAKNEGNTLPIFDESTIDFLSKHSAVSGFVFLS